MWDLLAAAAAAFGVVFAAELGDKSQLLALGYGARHPLRIVVMGLTIGYAAAGALAALAGWLLGAALPAKTIGTAAGLLFLVFAVLAWRDLAERDDGPDTAPSDREDERGVTSAARRSVVASIALTIAVAEFGDKTQLATAALAAQANPVATWFGATAGVVAAGTLGAIAGRQIGRRFDRRRVQQASVLIFATVGMILIVTAW